MSEPWYEPAMHKLRETLEAEDDDKIGGHTFVVEYLLDRPPEGIQTGGDFGREEVESYAREKLDSFQDYLRQHAADWLSIAPRYSWRRVETAPPELSEAERQTRIQEVSAPVELFNPPRLQIRTVILSEEKFNALGEARKQERIWTLLFSVAAGALISAGLSYLSIDVPAGHTGPDPRLWISYLLVGSCSAVPITAFGLWTHMRKASRIEEEVQAATVSAEDSRGEPGAR